MRHLIDPLDFTVEEIDSLLHGQSGCNRRHEQQNIFIFQDWAEIVPEHQLSG